MVVKLNSRDLVLLELLMILLDRDDVHALLYHRVHGPDDFRHLKDGIRLATNKRDVSI